MRLYLVENGPGDVVDEEKLAVLRAEDEPALKRKGEASAHDVRTETKRM